MGHYALGGVIVALGVIYFCAGYFKVRYWVFGRGERCVAEKYGVEKVFRMRKIKGMFGVVFGIAIIIFGNF